MFGRDTKAHKPETLFKPRPLRTTTIDQVHSSTEIPELGIQGTYHEAEEIGQVCYVGCYSDPRCSSRGFEIPEVCGGNKRSVSQLEVERMASDPKVPEAMEWQQEEGGDELCQDTAASEEAGSTRLPWCHSGGPAPRSPSLLIGFLRKERIRWMRGSKSAAPTGHPIITEPIKRLDTIRGQFDPHLKESRDGRHLSFGSLPSEVLLMAQELLKVK